MFSLGKTTHIKKNLKKKVLASTHGNKDQTLVPEGSLGCSSFSLIKMVLKIFHAHIDYNCSRGTTQSGLNGERDEGTVEKEANRRPGKF